MQAGTHSAIFGQHSPCHLPRCVPHPLIPHPSIVSACTLYA